MELRVGCAMWTYAPWQGRYLPRSLTARERLSAYATWCNTVEGWLGEGRSPTVFIHTPDNVEAPALARRFHEAVRARVPGVKPLPEPVPAGPPTLF